MFIILLASGSRGGLLAIVVTSILLIITLHKKIFIHWKSLLVILASMVVIFMLVDSVFEGRVTARIKHGVKAMFSASTHPLQDIRVDGSKIKIYANNQVIGVTILDGEIMFLDSEDKQLEILMNEDIVTFKDDNYKKYVFEILIVDGRPVLKLRNFSLRFLVEREGFKFINEKGRAVKMKEIESWGFEEKERWGSSRGYIWSRTIPMITKNWLIGYGPDTFSIHFPQHDFLGKIRAFGTIGMIVDKPHNMYLQTAVNSGLIDLIAKLAIFAIYLWASGKLFIKCKCESFYEIAGVGIFLGVFAYLVSGLFNDSVVSVAPVFWVLLGTGIAINKQISQRSATEN